MSQLFEFSRPSLFVWASWALLALLASLTDSAFQAGPAVVVIVALAISTIMMQVIARIFERRWMWPPRTQYLSFLVGDLVLLPTVALMIALAVHDLPAGDYWWHSDWWTLACLLVAFAASYAFRSGDRKVYPVGNFNSPTKLWHDLFVYPAFTFFLLKQAPALLFGDNAWWRITISVVALAIWGFLGGVYDARHPERISTAHPAYDWQALRPATVN